MQYILLIIGLIFIFIGIKGLKKDNISAPEVLTHAEGGQFSTSAPKDDAGEGQFSHILAASEVMYRLGSIEDKIDLMWSEIEKLKDKNMQYSINHIEDTQLHIKSEDLKDINRQITALKNQGMTIEEIADKLGMMKGEVLLRLGIKK